MRNNPLCILAAGILLATLTGQTPLTASAAQSADEAKAAAIKVADAKVAAAERALAEAKKAALKLKADEEVEKIKLAARKAAQERIKARKAAITAMTEAVKEEDSRVLKDFSDRAFREKIARDKEAVLEADVAIKEAEKALAEKDTNVKKTEAEAKAAAALADKKPDDEDLRKKFAAAKAVADRALRVRNGALNTLRSKQATADAARKQVVTGKEVISKLAEVGKLNQAYDDAVTQATAARKTVSEKTAAARTATRTAATARAAAKNAATKTATAKAANDRAAATLVAAKKSLANASEAEKKAMTKKLTQQASAAKKASTAFSQATATQTELNKKAVAAEVSSRKLAVEKTAADKARVEADRKVAVAKKKADQMNAAILAFKTAADAEKIDQERIAYEKAIAARITAEKALAKAKATARSAASKADSLKTASERAEAARAAAEEGLKKVAANEKNSADKNKAKAAALRKATGQKLGQAAAAAKESAEKDLAKAIADEKKANGKNKTKAVADRKAAEKNLARVIATAKANTEKALAKVDRDAKMSADKNSARVLAARKAGEKKLALLTTAAKKAAATATAARATADKAIAAEKTAAASDAFDETPAKNALARLYEAQALVDGGLALLPADQWDYAKARHLLCRAGFGGTPKEVEALYALGLHGAVEFMVDFHTQPALNLPFNAALPRPAVRDENRLSPIRRREISNVRRRAEGVQQTRLRDWWLQRMAQSPRQLEEKLTLFWHGHFASEYRTVRNSYAMYEQNQLFRAHAAGNFGALLHGIVHDPAMLRYLDNNSNIKGRPNENLAREIMELFSLGEGNYAEEDIMEGARALTGYSYDTSTSQFRFTVSRHDTENKTIFGRTGAWAGDDFVDLILQQPFAPRFISRKLFVYFTYENPDQEIVHRMATVLSKHRYEMAPMLKNLFMSKEFYSDKAMATQIKNPVQLAIGTLRDLGIKDISYGTLGTSIAGMGQEIFGPPNVRGWEGGQFWVNANRLFVRYNGIADLVERAVVPDQPRGLNVIGALEGEKLETPDQVIDYLARSCLIQPLTSEKKKILIEQASALPPSSEWESKRNQVNATLQAILVLMMSMPEYQTI